MSSDLKFEVDQIKAQVEFLRRQVSEKNEAINAQNEALIASGEKVLQLSRFADVAYERIAIHTSMMTGILKTALGFSEEEADAFMRMAEAVAEEAMEEEKNTGKFVEEAIEKARQS